MVPVIGIDGGGLIPNEGIGRRSEYPFWPETANSHLQGVPETGIHIHTAEGFLLALILYDRSLSHFRLIGIGVCEIGEHVHTGAQFQLMQIIPGRN